MEHKLVEKLKNAGFPFDFKESKLEDDTYTYPSLEKLIEACGDGYFSLESYQSKNGKTMWLAIKGIDLELTTGKTPKIAVANLWLKLNKK